MKVDNYLGNLLIKTSFLLILSQQILAESATKLLPMYGGEDRSQDSELVIQDKEFIAKAMRTFGTREHASKGYVEHGFNHYSNNKFDTSMERFNQAWLLNPENPYAYLGFGLLKNKNEQSCEAYEMFKLANEKGLNEHGFLADYAYTISECALLKKESERQPLFNSSNNFHGMATQTSNEKLLAYVYHSWAKSYYIQDDFIKSNEMIEQSKKFGGKIDKSLINGLEEQKNK